eukprot:4770614-Alexandrium_andersonii.AAC.1
MVPEPADTGHCLIHGVIAQASLAQRRVRQNGAGVAILDDQDCRRRVAAILGEEAIAHCNLWYRVGTREGARAGD